MKSRNRLVRRLRLVGRDQGHRLRALTMPLIAAFERRVMADADGHVVASSLIAGPRPRILLAVVSDSTASDLARVTAHLAGAGRAAGPTHDVVVVTVVAPGADIAPSADPVAGGLPSSDPPKALPPIGRAVAVLRAQGIAAGWIVRAASDVGAALRRETRRQHATLLVMGWTRGLLDEAEEQTPQDPAPTWLDEGDQERALLPTSLGDVLQFPPTDVLIVGGPTAQAAPRRPLVLLGAGRDDRVALEHAVALAGDHSGAGVAVLAVLPPDASPGASRSAERAARRVVADAGLGAAAVHVVAAPSRAEGALAVLGQGGFDAVVLATPPETLIKRRIFGGTQLRLVQRADVPVLVVDKRSPLLQYALQGVWTLLYDHLPKIAPAHQAEIEAEIADATRPSSDFFIMIGLSSAIAAIGLVQNSPAVIIGAMLVAPMMNTIFAAALGLVQGHPRLIASGLSASARGMGLAVVVSLLMGLVLDGGQLTPEMLTRTRPGFLDLGIALASGVAGAWALSRERVSASLPGVAIAVSLEPPLATAGLALAFGRTDAALGALLMFAINFVAIVAAGGLVFLLLGFGPTTEATQERAVLRHGAQLAALLLVVLVMLLGWATARVTAEVRGAQRIEAALAAGVADLEAAGVAPVLIRGWRREGAERIVVEAWATGAGGALPEPAVVVAALHARLATSLSPAVHVELTLAPVMQAAFPAPTATALDAPP